jgi:hypothetical protein
MHQMKLFMVEKYHGHQTEIAARIKHTLETGEVVE